MKLLECTCTEEFMQWRLSTRRNGGILVNVVKAEYSVGYADACILIDVWLLANMSWLIRELIIVRGDVVGCGTIIISLDGHEYLISKPSALYFTFQQARNNEIT